MDEAEFKMKILALPSYSTSPGWPRHCHSLRTHVSTSDKMSEFCRWSTVEATMCPGDNTFTRGELADLEPRYLQVCQTNGFGSPPAIDNLATPFIHQAYHLQILESCSNVRVGKFRSVIEFGGGFGAMRLIMGRLGFSGHYTIYDLPEFSLLQQYYLTNTGNRTSYITSLKSLKPPYDLLVACHSLSEAPEELRAMFFDACQPQACLIATQDAWDRQNLRAYWAEFAAGRPQYQWKTVPLKHVPGHFYLIGWRT